MIPAVFLYRLVTFWLPILPGWIALTYSGKGSASNNSEAGIARLELSVRFGNVLTETLQQGSPITKQLSTRLSTQDRIRDMVYAALAVRRSFAVIIFSPGPADRSLSTSPGPHPRPRRHWRPGR